MYREIRTGNSLSTNEASARDSKNKRTIEGKEFILGQKRQRLKQEENLLSEKFITLGQMKLIRTQGRQTMKCGRKDQRRS